MDGGQFPLAIGFERRAWKQMRTRISEGECDFTLRILPILPMYPDPFAFFLRKGPMPFVIGLLNAQVPWPKGFSQLDRNGQQPATGSQTCGVSIACNR